MRACANARIDCETASAILAVDVHSACGFAVSASRILTMSREAILAAIPHRDPFLLLDEIVEQGESRIVCRKRFTGEEYFFAGHYPQFPLVPGVILCEAAMQAGAVLLSQLRRSGRRGGVPVATRMNDVRFKQMVRPGDTIEIEVKLTERLAERVLSGGQSHDGRQSGRAVRVRLHAGGRSREAVMDFLQLAGKSIVVFGVANRKSVAWHVGRVLEEAGAKVVYVVRSERAAASGREAAAGAGHLRLRRRVRGSDRPASRGAGGARREVPRPGALDRLRRLRRRRQAVPRNAQGGLPAGRRYLLLFADRRVQRA